MFRLSSGTQLSRTGLIFSSSSLVSLPTCHHLFPSIEGIQQDLEKLAEIERKMNLGVLNFDQSAFDRLNQHSDRLHADMTVTEAELIKQGIPVASTSSLPSIIPHLVFSQGG